MVFPWQQLRALATHWPPRLLASNVSAVRPPRQESASEGPLQGNTGWRSEKQSLSCTYPYYHLYIYIIILDIIILYIYIQLYIYIYIYPVKYDILEWTWFLFRICQIHIIKKQSGIVTQHPQVYTLQHVRKSPQSKCNVSNIQTVQI